jgi:hypothetical protein
VTLMFAVAASRHGDRRQAGRVDQREPERVPDERRLLCLDMRTGAVVKGTSTPQTRRASWDRRDDDEDEFDGPDAA